jgi:hypothetical protein
MTKEVNKIEEFKGEATTVGIKKKIIEIYPQLLRAGSACKAVGISQVTLWKWRKNDPVFEAAWVNARLERGEYVEDKLMLAIKKNDWASVRFFLQSMHPEYKRKLELGGELSISNLETMGNDELAKQIGNLAAAISALKAGGASES